MRILKADRKEMDIVSTNDIQLSKCVLFLLYSLFVVTAQEILYFLVK